MRLGVYFWTKISYSLTVSNWETFAVMWSFLAALSYLPHNPYGSTSPMFLLFKTSGRGLQPHFYIFYTTKALVHTGSLIHIGLQYWPVCSCQSPYPYLFLFNLVWMSISFTGFADISAYSLPLIVYQDHFKKRSWFGGFNVYLVQFYCLLMFK